MLLILGFHVGAGFEEAGEDLLVVVHGCEVQGGLELVGEGVDVCSSLLQELYGEYVSVETGVVEGGPAVGIDDINISITLKN